MYNRDGTRVRGSETKGETDNFVYDEGMFWSQTYHTTGASLSGSRAASSFCILPMLSQARLVQRFSNLMKENTYTVRACDLHSFKTFLYYFRHRIFNQKMVSWKA